MWNAMEQATFQSEKDSIYDQNLAERRAFLAAQFQSIPTYGSAEYWSRIVESQSKLALLPIIDLQHSIRNAPSNATLRDSSRKARRIY
jgi:hypothetical protein